MKTTTWTCDNYCGAKVVGDVLPVDWVYLQAVPPRARCLCSYECLEQFAFKVRNNIPMGDKVGPISGLEPVS